MTALGARSDTCRRGHPWTDANTFVRRDGKRTCRRCATEGQATRRSAQRPATPAAATSPRPGGWLELALCAEVGGDLWFPGKGGSVREAKAICQRCPVRAECLDLALSGADTWDGLAFGVWGGLSERERRALREQRRAAA